MLLYFYKLLPTLPHKLGILWDMLKPPEENKDFPASHERKAKGYIKQVQGVRIYIDIRTPCT